MYVHIYLQTVTKDKSSTAHDTRGLYQGFAHIPTPAPSYKLLVNWLSHSHPKELPVCGFVYKTVHCIQTQQNLPLLHLLLALMSGLSVGFLLLTLLFVFLLSLFLHYVTQYCGRLSSSLIWWLLSAQNDTEEGWARWRVVSQYIVGACTHIHTYVHIYVCTYVQT